MRIGRHIMALILSASVTPASVLATTPAQQEDDAKCLLLSGSFSKSNDLKAQQAAFAAHFFYLGRLRTETAPDKMLAILIGASKTILPALAGASMQACVAEVAAAETDIARVGKQLQPAPAK